MTTVPRALTPLARTTLSARITLGRISMLLRSEGVSEVRSAPGWSASSIATVGQQLASAQRIGEIVSFTKRMLEESSRGGMDLNSADGMYVCAECFSNDHLRAMVSAHSAPPECSFCGSAGPSTPLRVIAEFIFDRLSVFYDDAAEWLPYETAEGGYQGATYDSWDLLQDHVELPRDDNGELLSALADAVGDRTWCKADPYGLRENESLRFSWQHFSEYVQQERRFFFLAERPAYANAPGDPYLDPGSLLSSIADLCIRHGLIRNVASGVSLFRARIETAGHAYNTALDLGPPPPNATNSSNRMSPPGIQMTYLADSPDTAISEVLPPAAPAGIDFAVAEFATTRDLKILDLTATPPVPSMFDEAGDDDREGLIFLRQFTRALSAPVAHDDRIHVEYVPTQVLTEFFRVGGGRPDLVGLDGLRFRSAQHAGGINTVVFAGMCNRRHG